MWRLNPLIPSNGWAKFFNRLFSAAVVAGVLIGNVHGGSMPEIGRKAPEFSLQDDTGETVSLKDFRGKKVVLYFYPKDDTPGCTKEACDFRDQGKKFSKENAV